jgi:hypothetical protein
MTLIPVDEVYQAAIKVLSSEGIKSAGQEMSSDIKVC